MAKSPIERRFIRKIDRQLRSTDKVDFRTIESGSILPVYDVLNIERRVESVVHNVNQIGTGTNLTPIVVERKDIALPDDPESHFVVREEIEDFRFTHFGAVFVSASMAPTDVSISIETTFFVNGSTKRVRLYGTTAETLPAGGSITQVLTPDPPMLVGGWRSLHLDANQSGAMQRVDLRIDADPGDNLVSIDFFATYQYTLRGDVDRLPRQRSGF